MATHWSPAGKSNADNLPELLNETRQRREEWFRVAVPDDLAKLAFLRQQAHELAVQPLTIELASNLVRPYRPDDWRAQADALHRFVRDGIRFQRHPDGRQQIADNSLWTGHGACTEKVMAFVALARALGIEADFMPVWKGDVMVHVQTGAKWPGYQKDPNARSSDEPGAPAGKWIISDPTIAGAPLGVDPITLPRNPETGRLPLS